MCVLRVENISESMQFAFEKHQQNLIEGNVKGKRIMGCGRQRRRTRDRIHHWFDIPYTLLFWTVSSQICLSEQISNFSKSTPVLMSNTFINRWIYFRSIVLTICSFPYFLKSSIKFSNTTQYKSVPYNHNFPCNISGFMRVLQTMNMTCGLL